MKTGVEKFNENTKKLFTPKEKAMKTAVIPDVRNENQKILIIPSESDQLIDVSNSDNPEIPEEKRKKIGEDFQQNLTEFRNTVAQTFSTWQNQWDAQMQKWKETNQANNAKFKAKIEENNAKIKQFFEQSHNQMKQNIEKIEEDWKNKNRENRQQFYQGLRVMRENWNNFVLEQQKTYEKNVVQFNKRSIHTEIRILIWALPFIFIILLFVYLFRPFFM